MTSTLFAGWNTDRVGTMTCLLTTSVVTDATVTIPSVRVTLAESTAGDVPVYLADGKVPGSVVAGEPGSQRTAIAEHVRRGLQQENKIDVVIKADRRVPHRDVARVMQAASQVEGVRLHLAVLEPNE